MFDKYSVVQPEQRLFESGRTPSANFSMQLVLRSFGQPQKAQVSCGFPDRHVDRQGCNEGRKGLSDGRMSPDLWTGVI